MTRAAEPRTPKDERYYAGEQWDEKLPSECPQGCGFRGVVRPRQLFQDLVPR